MDTVLVLAISLGGLLIIIGLWGLWHLVPRVYDIPVFYFLRTLAYPLIIQRRYWGSVTRIDAAVLFGYIAGNAICMYQRDTADLMVRSGKLAVVNMALLFLSSRTSLIADKAGIPLHSYYLAHHWVGRMFIAQGIIHAVLGLLNTNDKHKTSGIVLLSTVAAILVLSLFFIRKWSFEAFLVLHRILALLTIGVLVWHLFGDTSHWREHDTVNLIIPGVSIIFWLANRLFHLFFLRHKANNATIHNFKHVREKGPRSSYKNDAALELKVSLPHAIKMRPGQYFYVELSAEESWKNYFKTAHPLMAVWHKTSEPMTELGTECSNEIKFLIKPLDGHSLIHHPKVVLYGPYGKDLQLQSYENVMIVAQGIGISSVLSYIRQIVTWKSKGDIRKTVLTRKLDVFWLLDDNCEEDWLSEYLPELRKLDRKRILQFWSYYPNKQKKRGNNNAKSDKQEKKRKGVISEEQKKDEISVGYRCIDPESRYTPIPIAIRQETMNSPGKSIVVVCGSPLLTKSMRDNVRALMTRKNPIRFVEVEYRPHSDCFSEVRPEYLNNDVNSELRGVAPRQESSSGDVGESEPV